KLFFLQFFPRTEQERLKREYHSIRQTNTETSTDFMQCFLRLAGFLGAAAESCSVSILLTPLCCDGTHEVTPRVFALARCDTVPFKGIDIARPFPKGPDKVKFLIVAMDYFIKWIEAKLIATITALCFRQTPQANGLVKRANRSLGEGLKARLDERSNDWIEEVPHVLWAHRTMIKSSNGDTPFSLTYGTEAVIPAKIGMPTLRTAEIDIVQNDEALEINLDILEERMEQTPIREARSKAKMEKYYNSKVRNTSFRPGDLVYQNNDASHAKDNGKLSLKWEAPYEVTKALGNGAYKVRDLNGKHLLRTWNICNLKKCYLQM
nr:reverse transcriptase domain-containing protein [Tanacetum cinerariifolium]